MQGGRERVATNAVTDPVRAVANRPVAFGACGICLERLGGGQAVERISCSAH